MRHQLVVAMFVLAGCGAGDRGQRRATDPSGVFWEYDVTNGIPNGRSRTYYPDGSLRTKSSFLMAEKHGLFTAYEPDGGGIERAYFWHDILVWRSRSIDALPPLELLESLIALTDQESTRQRYGGRVLESKEHFLGIDVGAPIASFSSTDRYALDGNVVGATLGLGGGGLSLRATRRYTVYGQVARGANSGFLQFDTSSLDAASDTMLPTVSGRQTAEVGGTHTWFQRYGQLSSRLSLALPVSHDDANGNLASAAASSQRPGDAVMSVPGSVAVRASTSWLLQRRYWVTQTDIGLDVAADDAANESPVFGRLNAAAGFGVRSAMATIEFSSTTRLGAFEQHVFAFGAGARLSFMDVVVKGLLARTSDGFSTITLGSEYEF